jgi:hypothetical protein
LMPVMESPRTGRQHGEQPPEMELLPSLPALRLILNHGPRTPHRVAPLTPEPIPPQAGPGTEGRSFTMDRQHPF